MQVGQEAIVRAAGATTLVQVCQMISHFPFLSFTTWAPRRLLFQPSQALVNLLWVCSGMPPTDLEYPPWVFAMTRSQSAQAESLLGRQMWIEACSLFLCFRCTAREQVLRTRIAAMCFRCTAREKVLRTRIAVVW